jgi:hypothetical protein
MFVLVLPDIRNSTELPRHIQSMPQGERVHPQMFLIGKERSHLYPMRKLD